MLSDAFSNNISLTPNLVGAIIVATTHEIIQAVLAQSHEEAYDRATNSDAPKIKIVIGQVVIKLRPKPPQSKPAQEDT